MSEDTNDIGLEISLSENGVKASIKSRFFGAVDHLLGRKVQEKGLSTDRNVELHQALTASQVSMVQAATKTLIKDIEDDPQLARKVLSTMAKAERQLENVEQCLAITADALIDDAKKVEDDQPTVGVVQPDVLNRWEQYASCATTEDIRQRWGRVLASEVSKPGTFSMKTLRVVDELDQQTALLFEKFCLLRINNFVPKGSNRLTDQELGMLFEAGLIVSSPMPQYYGFGIGRNPSGQAWGGLQQGNYMISVRLDAPLKELDRLGNIFEDVTSDKGTVNFQVIALTSVGYALSTILPHDPLAAMQSLRQMLAPRIAAGNMMLGEKQSNSDFVTLI